MKRRSKERYERYGFEDSPWVQNLTQREFAALLGYKKQQLEAIVRDRDHYTKRETKQIGSKLRRLAVPTSKLRTIHERLKYHLNKIKQPPYLFSPRKGRAQRDNAEHHAGEIQFLTLDIRQFYPSTTDEHIFRWAHHAAGLRPDVAGLLTKLVVVDRRMPFGSPVSPVLTTHVHRTMFDQIYAICQARGLRMSLWVDDLTISGAFVKGDVVEEIRGVIRRQGFDTHKIKFRTSSRPVVVTGVPIEGGRVRAPRSLHRRIQDGYAGLRLALTDLERSQKIDRLLSALGTYRYHLGAATTEGRKAADRMHALRQRRAKLDVVVETAATAPGMFTSATGAHTTFEAPWD